MMTTPSLSWKVERHGDATILLRSPALNYPHTLAAAKCVTIREGVAEATRSIVIHAAQVGCQRMTGYVFCDQCDTTIAVSGVEEAGPGGWHVYSFNEDNCASCRAAWLQYAGHETRKHVRVVPQSSATANDAARAFLSGWCRRLLHAGGVRRVELRVDLDDGDSPSLRASLRVVGDPGLGSWRIVPAASGAWSVDVDDLADADQRVAASDTGDVVDIFVAEIERTEIPCPAVEATLRGPELLTLAGETDDTIFWDATGGPLYAPDGERSPS